MQSAWRRVVVTGVGLVTPLGVGVKHAWPRLLAGASGLESVGRHSSTKWESIPSQVAGIIPRGPLEDGCWDHRDHLSKTEARNTALFSQYAMAAAEEALQDSGVLSEMTEQEREATGVVIGSGIGNLEDQYDTGYAFATEGHHKVHPLYVPRLLINMAAGHIAMRHGFKGPNMAPTTACTTGLHSIFEGAQLIRNPSSAIFGHEDAVDFVIAGASEACIHPLAFSGFARARSLSTSYNNEPKKASRPFDKDRDGFIIGEGAGVVILEERERAIRRGAPIYAELVGAGMSCDANHMTAPPADGNGARLAMKRALQGLTKMKMHDQMPRSDQISEHSLFKEVDYINAHATGTDLGDAAESRAIKRMFEGSTYLPQGPMVSSTKGATGHLLGAAGAVEAIFTLLSMRHGGITPTLNLEAPSTAASTTGSGAESRTPHAVEPSLDYVTDYRASKPRIALSNSFGFGGTNASVCFANFENHP